jgi:hypothetical protein
MTALAFMAVMQARPVRSRTASVLGVRRLGVTPRIGVVGLLPLTRGLEDLLQARGESAHGVAMVCGDGCDEPMGIQADKRICAD